MKKINKPIRENVNPFYQFYMDQVPDDGNLLTHLSSILTESKQLINTLSEEKLNYRYAPGKWTIKDILVHLSDCERVIIYRAMRMARTDKTNLPGFDENLFAENANAGDRKLVDIFEELSAFRAASITFIKTLSDEELDRVGTANNFPLSARILVNHVYAHHHHHLKIIRDRYLTAD
ncbi:MAG: DinB family protein [Sediminibacterium sp.]